MSTARVKRETKRQMGQFLTPLPIARAIVSKLDIDPNDIVLEPSFGRGAFIYAYLERIKEEGVDIKSWATDHLCGCELDEKLFDAFSCGWSYGNVPPHIVCGDFFRYEMPSFNRKEYFSRLRESVDLVIGNPPFGGTIDGEIQDELDSIFGVRDGNKIKKETYSFFIMKCLDMLRTNGRLVFICSDTLLSIATMSGLRRYLTRTCAVSIEHLPGDFVETQQPMVVIQLQKGGSGVVVFGEEKPIEYIERTPNFSWMINAGYAKYFSGHTLGEKMIATSGMTVGKNEFFLRKIVGGKIEEKYDFEIKQRPISLAREFERARLGKISEKKRLSILQAEREGKTEPFLEVVPRSTPKTFAFPHPDYAPYNKATNALVFAPPKWAVFWRGDGAYLYAYKKAGPWYLHGVGGKPFFKREGITWQLISSHLNMRYLPAGYILDSGAPCAFLREGIEHDELYFIMGWCLTRLCNLILKNVINHTRNIQSKDFERLPYPIWVSMEKRKHVIEKIKTMVEMGMKGCSFDYKSKELSDLDKLFAFDSGGGKKKAIKQGQFLFK